MKAGILFATIIFWCLQSFAQIFPVDTLMRNGLRSNRINMVYIADGYQSAQMPLYIINANSINNYLFSQPPFSEYKSFFNSFAIKVPSTDNGALHPGTAGDEATSGGQPVAAPSTFFQSTFDYGSIHRLLVPQDYSALFNVLAANLPDYNQGIVVVNSPYYGGSGGTYATASTNSSSADVATHELGHSFAGLADEYWAGPSFAAEKPNLTQNNDPATIRWKNWLNINGVGIYAHAESPTWFRPHQSCKMRALGNPFCSVCAERIIDVIHQKVNMIDGFSPTATSFTLTNNDSVRLSLNALQTMANTITVKWFINSSTVPFSSNTYSVAIPVDSFIVGTNTLRAEVRDSTPISKSYLPGAGYIKTITWTINKPTVLSVKVKSFTGTLSNNTALLNWEIDSPDDLQMFELQKSKDGSRFSKQSIIAPESLKRFYKYADEKLMSPSTFYRLKVLEKDGGIYYSGIVQLQNPFHDYSYKVYQNADLHRYHLIVQGVNNGSIAVLVSDAAGKMIVRKNFSADNTQVDYNIDLATQPAGVYFLILKVNSSSYAVQLIAK